MEKYTREDMVKNVMNTAGCSEVKAVEIVKGLIGGIEEALLSGSQVLLTGIGTITPDQKDQRVAKIFGVETELDKKLKLTLKTSRTLNDKFKQKKVKVTDFKQVGDLFLQKK